MLTDADLPAHFPGATIISQRWLNGEYIVEASLPSRQENVKWVYCPATGAFLSGKYESRRNWSKS